MTFDEWRVETVRGDAQWADADYSLARAAWDAATAAEKEAAKAEIRIYTSRELNETRARYAKLVEAANEVFQANGFPADEADAFKQLCAALNELEEPK